LLLFAPRVSLNDHRRLAAILAAEVRFSSMMEKDEEGC
jgi:hypothetical protein